MREMRAEKHKGIFFNYAYDDVDHAQWLILIN